MKRSYALAFGIFLVILGFFAGKFFGSAVPAAIKTGGFSGKNAPSAISSNSRLSRTETVLVSRVIDGDTIELENGERVRYVGINAPETVDPRKPVECFGKEASARNRELIEGKIVRLEKDVSDRDKYGRLLRYVWLGGTMINFELVREGYASASAYPPDVKYSSELTAAEKEARLAGRGLWNGCKGNPAAAPTGDGSASAGGCFIKGNIGSTGEKIYHLPGCPYYDSAKIDVARGERWFCSEAEAVSAGWRKALNCP